MASQFKLLVKNARQVVRVCSNGEAYLSGEAQGKVEVMPEDDGPYSLLIGQDGFFKEIGKTKVLDEKYNSTDFEKVLDATGQCILPGFVDAHTHSVWEGDRVHEFAMKLAGATYMDIHKAGGGIHFTVTHTQQASEDSLCASLKGRLMEMMQSGSTLIEVKSGYGLTLEDELKMLKVIDRARKNLPVDISSTYCGAHAVPKGKTSEEATTDIMNVHLPMIKELMSAGQLQVDNIDVFCEKGVFDVTQTKTILSAGQAMGMQINFHGEELNCLNSVEMGAELGALAISHLEEVSEPGMDAMALSKTAAVLLPTTAYNLRLRVPPAREMIRKGVIVALGTDFNPNAYCLAMPLVMNLACVTLHMSMPEVLVAATLNAAYALGRSKTHGSLEIGKVGDFVLVDAPSWEHLIYRMGCHSNLIKAVVRRGTIVHSRE